MSTLTEEAPPVAGAQRILASPRQMVPWPDLNTRKAFPRERVAKIADSMRRHGGNLQNLVLHNPQQTVVVDGAEVPLYWIVAGETRWRSANLIVDGDAELGWEPRPEFVLDCRVSEFTRAEALEILLIENRERGNLTVIEEARGIQKLIEEEGYTQARVAEKIFGDAAKQPQVNQLLGLLEMPDAVQDLLEQGHLVFSHVRDHLRPLWGRLSEDRRGEVLAGIVGRIRGHVENDHKVAGPWLAELVREADAEEARLRGQVSLLDDLPEEAPPADAPAAADEAGQVEYLVREALQDHLLVGYAGASDAELLERIGNALPLEMAEPARVAGVGTWRVQRTPGPVLVIHPEAGTYPWSLQGESLLEYVRKVFTISAEGLEATCRFCACSDSVACPGGCSWVTVDREKGEGVCSNPDCVRRLDEEQAAVPEAAPADSLATPGGKLTEQEQVDGLIHNACTAYAAGEWTALRERPQVTDVDVASTVRFLLRDADDAPRFVEGLGTWTPAVDAHTLRISVIPSATKATRHIRDAELLRIVRRVMLLPDAAEAAAPAPAPPTAPPAASPRPAPASGASRAATPAARPAPTPSTAPPAAPAAPPVAVLPPMGAGRRPIPQGAGVVATLLAVCGDRPCTLNLLPTGQGIVVTVAPRPLKAGEIPFTHCAGPESVDEEFIARLDAHFT
ncbi:MAG TPA: ParB N-terminal domain-containing protein [Longimicrobium sp.]|nr:ParB N-terminal domain-containing protein [Longimicrobium sp.]